MKLNFFEKFENTFSFIFVFKKKLKEKRWEKFHASIKLHAQNFKIRSPIQIPTKNGKIKILISEFHLSSINNLTSKNKTAYFDFDDDSKGQAGLRPPNFIQWYLQYKFKF
jgi:hypothetical protein